MEQTRPQQCEATWIGVGVQGVPCQRLHKYRYVFAHVLRPSHASRESARCHRFSTVSKLFLASRVSKAAFPCATCFGHDNPFPISNPGSPTHAYFVDFTLFSHRLFRQTSGPQSPQSVTHLMAPKTRSATGSIAAFSKRKKPNISFKFCLPDLSKMRER